MTISIFTLILGALCPSATASEQSFSAGLGPYHGGLGVAYTYSPVIGLGLQAGVGLGGVALGARWQPTWLSGGYAQAGVARVGDGYHPNMIVGGKWTLSDSDLFLDANGGIGVSLGGRWWPIWDVGVGVGF